MDTGEPVVGTLSVFSVDGTDSNLTTPSTHTKRSSENLFSDDLCSHSETFNFIQNQKFLDVFVKMEYVFYLIFEVYYRKE